MAHWSLAKSCVYLGRVELDGVARDVTIPSVKDHPRCGSRNAYC
jgi:hypothetical protein